MPDVRVWQEDESPYQRIAQGLKDRGIASAKIGIEGQCVLFSPTTREGCTASRARECGRR